MGKIRFHRKKKKVGCFIAEKSNVIQLDDMGYPLMLCIMENGDQCWIDVGEKWAKEEVEKGNLKILEWTKIERGEDYGD